MSAGQRRRRRRSSSGSALRSRPGTTLSADPRRAPWYRRGVRLAAEAALVVVGLLGLGVPSLVGAVYDLREAEAHLTAVERAVSQLEVQEAAALRAQAEQAFERAGSRLRSPLLWPVRAMPLGDRQVRVAVAAADAGVWVSRGAGGLIEAVGAAGIGWRLQDGQMDMEALARASQALDAGVFDLARARRTMDAAPASLLVAPLASARADLAERLGSGEQSALTAASGLRAIGLLLGAEESQRYFIAVANLSELRGAGGFIGYFGVLDAHQGRLQVGDFGRPTAELPTLHAAQIDVPEWYRDSHSRRGGTAIWQSANVSTDFPTVAGVIGQAASRSPSIGRVDGVVQIDPVGLAALLMLTGPVHVEPWPHPINAANVARVTQHEIYVHFAGESDDRFGFLGSLTEAVADRLLDGELALGREALDELGRAVAGGHIQMHAFDPSAAHELERVGLSRGISRAAEATDVIGVVGQNWSPSKIDWFLRRRISYEVALDPYDPDGMVQSTVVVAMANTAPARGLPDYVIGTNISEGVPHAANRQYVTVLRPPDDELEHVSVDGEQQPVGRDRESHLRSYSRFVTIPSGEEAYLQATFSAPRGLVGEGRHRTYRLHVLRQPVAHPDVYSIRVQVPRGWKATGPTSFEGPITADVILEVQVTQTRRAWLVDRFVARPWGLLRVLVGSMIPGGG